MTVKVEVTSNDVASPEVKGKKAFMDLAFKRFDSSKEAFTEDRNMRVSDLKFRSGDQWPDNIVQDRANDERPALTINQLPHFIRLVTNEMRQNRPAITIDPTNDEATQETAKILQGMCRHIEFDSNADFAYDTAGDAQVTHGLGWFRVITQYEDPMSFDQILKIKRIRNSFSVYNDPTTQEPDGSDSKWCFIAEDMTQDEYKAAYPDSLLAKNAQWQGLGNPMPGWITAEGCRVVEYFYIENRKAKIWLLDDRTVVEDSELEYGEDKKPVPPTGRALMGSRDTMIPTVKWCKMNGIEVLEETDWLGKWIPVVPVIGDELDIDGKVTYEGVVRHAKDPQRMYNYWASAETETIALAPKAPFIGMEGQFEGHEDKWRQANKRNMPYLEYKNVSINGKDAPPPQRNVAEPPVRAITQAREMAGNDIKATTGTFDPALGLGGNETSGRAIIARQSAHGTTNFHYGDNMARSIRHLGRICIDLIPKIYDAKRVTRIVNPDGTSELVTINGEFMDKGGVSRIYDVRKGKYDVVSQSGPSYATKRQETVATMMQLAMAWPQIVQIAGDLMVKSMDWEGANEIAERLKKMLPPQLQDTSDVPPAVQQQIQQLRGMVQQLTSALHATTQKLETKVMDIQSKERIALNKNLTDLIMVAEQNMHDSSKTAFTTMADHLNQQLDRLGEQDPMQAAQQGAAELSAPPAATNTQPPQDGTQPLQPSPQVGQT